MEYFILDDTYIINPEKINQVIKRDWGIEIWMTNGDLIKTMQIFKISDVVYYLEEAKAGNWKNVPDDYQLEVDK